MGVSVYDAVPDNALVYLVKPGLFYDRFPLGSQQHGEVNGKLKCALHFHAPFAEQEAAADLLAEHTGPILNNQQPNHVVAQIKPSTVALQDTQPDQLLDGRLCPVGQLVHLVITLFVHP